MNNPTEPIYKATPFRPTYYYFNEDMDYCSEEDEIIRPYRSGCECDACQVPSDSDSE